jgi:crossover junction endodeoxyribonuclease RuvC
MLYLAIDPGYDKLGFCFFKQNNTAPFNFQIIDSGLIKTNKNKKVEQRLSQIYKQLKSLMEEYGPKKIILEELFFFKNQKTMVKVAMVHGVLALLADEFKSPLQYLSPLMIKQTITGYGRADKLGVRKLLQQQLQITKKIKEDDEIDAIACGFTYLLINRD